MAENRLLREDNPEPGERRGYVPQHLEAGSQEYSKTEGSDGRLHTKSMIVDQNGEPFEQENPVPVQLTGSIEELNSFTGQTIVTAGSSYTLLSYEGQQRNLYKEIRVSFRWDSRIPCKLKFENIASDGFMVSNEEVEYPGQDPLEVSYVFQVFSSRYEISIVNQSTDDQSIRRFTVLGVM